MILEYGFKNFLSFKHGASVSFRLDGNVPDAVSGGLDYSRVLCVKGANGSGKTHLLKALAFISNFISDSFSYNVKSAIPISPFGASVEPISFYVEFRSGDIEYIYELDAIPKGVLRESLSKKQKRRTPLFEREGDSIKYAIKSLEKIKGIRLRSNASVISIAHQHEIGELREFKDIFSNISFNVTSGGVATNTFINIGKASEYFYEHPEPLKFVVDFLRQCDTGVEDIRISREEAAEGNFNYSPVFVHMAGGEEILVGAATESSGTKQLFCQIIAYGMTLSSGGVLILDEFDQFLHPDLLPKLLNLFMGVANERGAQLLFSSHHYEVMDMCGRYRTYLVSKEDNASFAYRLDEIPGDILRNDRPIVPAYKSGRIGGVPKL